MSFITRLLLVCAITQLFVGSMKSESSSLILEDYYQSLIDISFFYYELDVVLTDEDMESLLAEDIDDQIHEDNYNKSYNENKQQSNTIDIKEQSILQTEKLKKIDTLPKDKVNKEKFSFAIYKESQNEIFNVIIKNITKKRNNNDLFFYRFLQDDLEEKKANDKASNPLYLLRGIDINYVDYLLWYRHSYDFSIIKTNSTDYFIKGVLNEDNPFLFKEIHLTFSKEYNSPTKIVLTNEKKPSVSINFKDFSKIGGVFFPTKFIIYISSKKAEVDLKNIRLGLPIDVDNSYLITSKEYLSLLNSEDNE